jgi:hypothetical protein
VIAQQTACEFERIATAWPRAEQQREQFCIGECANAALEQFLAGAFAAWPGTQGQGCTQ